MPTGANFRLSRIVIVESLESHELKTGAEVAELVNTSDDASRLRLAAEYCACDNAPEFIRIVSNLSLDVQSTGRVPLLHVECHGDQDEGLEFRNGSVLGWQELSSLLVDLNHATRFNLIAVFSACYGAHFLARMDSIDPAPCYAMIAPTDAVRDYEILSGFRTFYTTLFRERDAGVAIDAMMKLNLTEGKWFAELAEFWYERVTVGYVQMHCTKSEMKRRALRMHRKLQADGSNVDLGGLKRSLVELNRLNLLGAFFDRYFMTKDIPENAPRFQALRSRVDARLRVLRASGRYGI